MEGKAPRIMKMEESMNYIISWGKNNALGVKRVAVPSIARREFEKRLAQSEVTNKLCKKGSPFILRVDFVKIDRRGGKTSESREWNPDRERWRSPEYSRLISDEQKKAILDFTDDEI